MRHQPEALADQELRITTIALLACDFSARFRGETDHGQLASGGTRPARTPLTGAVATAGALGVAARVLGWAAMGAAIMAPWVLLFAHQLRQR